MTNRARMTGNRFWLCSLVLLAVFARFMIPAGFMPAMADTGPGIVICTATGIQVVPAGDADPAPDHESSALSCPYAPVLTQDVVAGVAVPAMPLSFSTVAPVPAEATVDALPRHPYAAQGPPASATI